MRIGRSKPEIRVNCLHILHKEIILNYYCPFLYFTTSGFVRAYNIFFCEVKIYTILFRRKESFSSWNIQEIPVYKIYGVWKVARMFIFSLYIYCECRV